MRFVLGHLGKGTSKKLHELVEQMELEKTIDDCQPMKGIATVQKVASFFFALPIQIYVICHRLIET